MLRLYADLMVSIGSVADSAESADVFYGMNACNKSVNSYSLAIAFVIFGLMMCWYGKHHNTILFAFFLGA